MQTQKEKILIIENDAAFGDQVADSLKKSGYSVLVARTGIEGVKMIYDIEPELILLDVTLPDADAYEILAKKQAEALITKIPLFLISAQGVPINMNRVPEGSVAEFMMALHSNPEAILEKVDRHFGHEPATPAPNASDGPKKRILWVEDDKLIGTILAKKMIASGFDLFHAKSGEEALDALKQVIPDVIVLDLLLPGMNGFDILAKINEDTAFKKVPVMILSNLSKPSDIDRAKTLGARRFLIKAASSLEEIIKEIRTLCNEK